jgi:hypothetical protein
MSSYVKPQVLVFQEFSIVPTEITEPLRAHIAGPNGILHRYSDNDEKKFIRLGKYDRFNDVCYPWPQRRPGSLVDLDYVKLYIDNALLKYFEHELSSPYTTITAVDNGQYVLPNWIQSDDLSFKSNTAAFPRSSDFADRDVQLGDIVYLRAVSQDNDCVETEFWSEIRGFASDMVPSRIKPATADGRNQPTVGALTSVPSPEIDNFNYNYLQVGGRRNCVKLTDVDGSEYDGLASGDITETYTVQVVRSSIAGCTAARLRIRSASGRDDVEELQPSDFGVPTPIGTRGLTVTFNVNIDSDCVDDAANFDVAADQFVVGQRWSVTVRQAFEAVTVTSAYDGNATIDEETGDILGAYNGAKNDTYIVEVTKGGVTSSNAAGYPEVSVRTVKGLDFSGPHEVVLTGDGETAEIGIGTNGVKINVSAPSGLRKGDKFYIAVVSSKAGPVRKLILRDDLPSVMKDTFVAAKKEHDPVRVATTENLEELAGLLTIDGVMLVSGNRVLVKNQDDASENGIYVVPAEVDGEVGEWTRASDADTTGEIITGSFVTVQQGATLAGSGWLVTTAGLITVGVTPIHYRRDDDAQSERLVRLDLKLYIKDNIQVSKNRIGFAPQTNYWFEDTQICVQEGIVAYHPEWTSGGAEQPLVVESGVLYSEYREWVFELADQVNAINTPADLDQIPGQLHPDNPLKWGVYKALSNSNGTVVKYTAVLDPKKLDSWVQVLERLKGRDDLYNLVPLTYDRMIQNLWAAHIGSESNEYANNWKAGFFSLLAEPNQLVVGQGAPIAGVLGNEMPEPMLATLADDPNATNTQYTLLQVPQGTTFASGYFITNDVRPGDIVRYNYTVDAFGEEQYEEYVVDRVLSENSLLLFTGADADVTVPQRFEIWHSRNRNEVAEHIAQQAGSLSNRRVCAVWPDLVGEAGTVQPGYFLACALAGLVSGVVPHQPLTNVEVAGFDDFTRSYKYFNETQLNRMAEAGVWIVTEDRDGTPHTRHALTTDNLDLNRREEMIRRNVDSMSYLFYRRLRPYIGRTNAQPGMVAKLEYEVRRVIEFLKTNGNTQELGSQLIDGTIRKLQIHPLLKDRIEIVLDLVVPAPLNNIELHLVV